jgi:hypothetical protein
MRQGVLSLVGQYSDTAPVLDFLVNGHFLYAACGEQGLRIFDVADPARPRLVGQYPAPTDSRTIDTRKVSVIGNMAYLANWIGLADGYSISGSFDVLDVSDPANPKLLGSVSVNPTFQEMQVAGDRAYLAEPTEIVTDGTYGAEGDLRTIDVSNPAKPTLLGLNFRATERVGSFGIVGSLIYLACDNLWSWDISTPADPRRIAQYFVHANNLRVSGRSVYFWNDDGNLVTWQDSTNLHLAGDREFPISGASGSFDVWGDYIFVTQTGGRGLDFHVPGGVQVFDVSNTAKLVEIGFSSRSSVYSPVKVERGVRSNTWLSARSR